MRMRETLRWGRWMEVRQRRGRRRRRRRESDEVGRQVRRGRRAVGGGLRWGEVCVWWWGGWRCHEAHITYSTGVFGTQLIKQRRGEMQKGWDRPSRWWGLAGANAQPPELLTAVQTHRNYGNTFTLFSLKHTPAPLLILFLIPSFVIMEYWDSPSPLRTLFTLH